MIIVRVPANPVLYWSPFLFVIQTIVFLYRGFVWLLVISLVDGDGDGGVVGIMVISMLGCTKYITSVSSIKIFPQSKPTLGGDYSFLQLYISFNTLTTLLNIL